MDFFLKNILTPIGVSIISAIIIAFFTARITYRYAEQKKIKKRIIFAINNALMENLINNYNKRLNDIRKLLIEESNLIEKNKIVKNFYDNYLYYLLESDLSGIVNTKIDFLKNSEIYDQIKDELKILKKEIK